jgi:Short C-terminal domain
MPFQSLAMPQASSANVELATQQHGSLWSLSAGLFAANRDDPLTRPEIIWGTVLLTATMLVGAAVIYAVDKWRKRAAEGNRDSTSELTDYRAMYEAGEITEAEYAELKRKLADKMKKADAAAVAAPPPAAQPGERPTLNPPAPPPPPPESPPPPSTA